MTDSDDEKALRERAIFSEFCVAAGFEPDSDSVQSQLPPLPDIVCKLSGRIQRAELAEIVDQELAHRQAEGLRVGRITGGAYSQESSLARTLDRKASTPYETAGAPLWLIAYYDKQYPAEDADPTLIARTIGGRTTSMLASGNWQGIWIYDSWNRRVLWHRTVGRPSSESFMKILTAAGWLWGIWGAVILVSGYPTFPATTYLPAVTCIVYAEMLVRRRRAAIPFGWVLVVIMGLSGWMNGLIRRRLFQAFLVLQAALAIYSTRARTIMNDGAPRE